MAKRDEHTLGGLGTQAGAGSQKKPRPLVVMFGHNKCKKYAWSAKHAMETWPGKGVQVLTEKVRVPAKTAK